jgi:hypothetical protein
MRMPVSPLTFTPYSIQTFSIVPSAAGRVGDALLSLLAATKGEVAPTVDAVANTIERKHDTASRLFRFNR